MTRKAAVPLSAFLYQRALTCAWTRYRQEWAYKPIALFLAASFSNGENRLGKASDGDGCLDRGMRIVADEREILELEIVNIFDRTIELHLR